MARSKMIYVSEGSHRRLKLLAARRGTSMGKLVEELVERETEDLDNPWLGPSGRDLQGRTLERPWGDPELDVYDED